MSSANRAREMMADILRRQVSELCAYALTIADFNVGVSTVEALASEEGKGRAVVVVLCGPIPDDLVQALGTYCKGLTQDLKTDGTVKFIHES